MKQKWKNDLFTTEEGYRSYHNIIRQVSVYFFISLRNKTLATERYVT